LIRLSNVGKKRLPPPNLGKYLMVGEAAAHLGVSASTLRNWDRSGKLAAHRHPINGYRLYEKAELEKLLARAHRPKKPRSG
jgi:excisionase family DNA binding protein